MPEKIHRVNVSFDAAQHAQVLKLHAQIQVQQGRQISMSELCRLGIIALIEKHAAAASNAN